MAPLTCVWGGGGRWGVGWGGGAVGWKWAWTAWERGGRQDGVQVGCRPCPPASLLACPPRSFPASDDSVGGDDGWLFGAPTGRASGGRPPRLPPHGRGHGQAWRCGQWVAVPRQGGGGGADVRVPFVASAVGGGVWSASAQAGARGAAPYGGAWAGPPGGAAVEHTRGWGVPLPGGDCRGRLRGGGRGGDDCLRRGGGGGFPPPGGGEARAAGAPWGVFRPAGARQSAGWKVIGGCGGAAVASGPLATTRPRRGPVGWHLGRRWGEGGGGWGGAAAAALMSVGAHTRGGGGGGLCARGRFCFCFCFCLF